MSIQNRRPRRRSLTQLVLLALLPVAFLALGSAPAGAASIDSLSTSTQSDGLQIHATGDAITATVTAHYVRALVCHFSFAPPVVTPGRHCDALSYDGQATAVAGEWHATVTVHQTFENTSFIPNVDPLTEHTLCKSSPEDTTEGAVQCYFVASFYNTTGSQVGSDFEPIWITS